MGKSYHRNNNIFYGVIHNETSFTELFCNFLSHKLFRNKFIELVNTKIEEDIKKLVTSKISYESFDTEIDLNGNGRADLFLELDSANQYIFEIKIKRYTSLTDKQPHSYLEYLKQKGGKDNLFFVIPKYYAHENEILETLSKNQIIYWEEIIELIEKNGFNKLNPLIDEFYIYCKDWFEMHIIEFSVLEHNIIDNHNFIEEKEILKMAYDTNVPMIMEKINQLVDEIRQTVGFGKINAEAEFYGYGKNLNKDKNGNCYYLWIGVDYEIWKKYNFPISLQIIDTDNLGKPQFNNLNAPVTLTKVETNSDDDIYIVELNKKIYNKGFTDYVIQTIQELQNQS